MGPVAVPRPPPGRQQPDPVASILPVRPDHSGQPIGLAQHAKRVRGDRRRGLAAARQHHLATQRRMRGITKERIPGPRTKNRGRLTGDARQHSIF